MNKKSHILKLIIFFFVLLILSQRAYSDSNIDDTTEENDLFIKEQLKSLDIKELEEILKDIDSTTYEYFPKINFKEYILSLISGKSKVSGTDILKGIFSAFFSEVIQNISLLLKILAITVICAVLTNLQNNFQKDTVGELAYYICYLLIATIIIKNFAIIINLGKETVDNMVNFMQVILPVLLTLLIAVGGATTGALFHPMVLGTVNIVGTLVKDVIFPLIFFAFIIGIISELSKKIQFTKLSELIRQSAITIMGVSLTVFIGIMSVYGVTSKVDGVTARTAKFAVDKFIPIVGKFLSDAIDTVVGCSTILKNAVGVIGLLSIFLICILPIIKIIALIFTYKVVMAIMEPISDTKIISCLNEVSKSLLLVLASVLSVGIMFFITITIIVQAGNITMMLR